MEKKRIEFVDHLRGLALIGVVWFHTAHPAFLDFSWRIPLFFFISGIFFRPYEPKVFIKKKINQLIVPTMFFYVLYCLYYLALWIGKNHGLSGFDYRELFGIFGLYSGSEAFIINPPLWFIFALLDIQFVMYALVKLIHQKWAIFIISLVISIIGVLWLYHLPTPFMISRSTPYFIYFALGYLCGMPLLRIIDKGHGRDYWILLGLSTLAFLFSIIAIYVYGNISDGQFGVLDYMAILSFIIILVFLMQKLYRYKICDVFNFFGRNTFVLLGVHEMLLTIMLIGVNHIFGENNLLLGIIQVILVLCITYPLTLWCNKYIPKFIGKQDLF